MEIETITKRTFRSEQEKAYNNLIFTNNWLQTQHKNFFEQFGLTQQQYNVMKVLKTFYPNPCKANALQGKLLEKTPDISRIIERLRVKMLVERKWKEGDRRSVDIVLTNKGMGLLFKVDTDIHRLESVFMRLNNTEVTTLNQLLDKLRG
jgi:MarR family transcriptional regulator, multiple gene regulator MgrA